MGDLGYDWFGGEEGDYEDFDSEFGGEEHVPDFLDYQQLMDWAGEFVERVNIYVLPTDELWELTPDDGLLPMRFLEQEGVDVESLLDLLTDITLLLEQPLPLTMLVNASTVVSVCCKSATTWFTRSLTRSTRRSQRSRSRSWASMWRRCCKKRSWRISFARACRWPSTCT